MRVAHNDSDGSARLRGFCGFEHTQRARLCKRKSRACRQPTAPFARPGAGESASRIKGGAKGHHAREPAQMIERVDEKRSEGEGEGSTGRYK